MFAPTVINMLGFKVNTVDNSTSAVGPIQQVDVFLSYKRNYGIGESNGDASPQLLPSTAINDPDASDSPTFKASII